MPGSTHSLLGQLAGTLVLAVAQQLNDAALVGGETSNLLNDVTDEGGALAQVTLETNIDQYFANESREDKPLPRICGRMLATYLGAGDTGLVDTASGLLLRGK